MEGTETLPTIKLTDPKKVVDALSEGQKTAVFVVDIDGKPQKMLSEIRISFFADIEEKNDLVSPAIRYLKTNFHKDAKLSVLASLCDLSPSYFSRLFNKSAGKSVTEYVKSLRLQKACELLLSTDRSVVSIAAEVGYVDCGYFCKLFKKQFACTPLEYRKNGYLI